MTKGRLLKYLESYEDDTEIFVITRKLDRNNLTTVQPIAAVHGYTWPGDRLKHEVWLQLEEE